MNTLNYFSKNIKTFVFYLGLLITFSALFSACQKPNAKNISLPKVFSNNMVLQRNADIAVWGTADPGGIVQVTLQEAEKTAEADKNGKWSLALPPMEAGGPYEMTIKGASDTTLSNILIGDVWVASGQSNMEWALKSQVDNFQEEIANANYPEIRLFTVTKDISPKELTDIKAGSWSECSPETVPNFSAVAYFFGRDIYEAEKVPIGLIHTSWGGTPSEAWTSKGTIKTFDAFAPEVEKLDAMAASYDESKTKEKEAVAAKEKIIKDANNRISALNFKPDFDQSAWKTMEAPVLWEEAKDANMSDFDGFVWFGKTVEVPATYAGKPLTLQLGQIDDNDITWFNGTKIGETNAYNQLRTYEVPGNLVKSGSNTITIRVEDTGGGGGLYGPADEMKIMSADKKFSKSLTGSWKYDDTIEPKFPVVPSQSPNQPSVLYNAMVAPLIPFSIKGVIWYQGESNATRAYQYRSIFPAMIEDWRKNWDIGNFPFLFVQLANFKERKAQPADDDWAELREAQTMTLSLPKTGMAVTIDVGEAGDIHPKNKQDVGKRLALAARKIAYDESIVYSGPMYESMKKEGNDIILKFSNVGEGLMKLPDEKLKGFAIAGEDHQFVWATAEIISKDEIKVSNPNVTNPEAVRYGWASNPEVNLYNQEGLPASPFRTDDWKGITQPEDV